MYYLKFQYELKQVLELFQNLTYVHPKNLIVAILNLRRKQKKLYLNYLK